MTAMPAGADPAGYACYPSLRGRTVFVTGGASGIGASEVMHFAAQGAKVAFVDINDAAATAVIRSVHDARDPEPFYQHCDLKDIDSLRQAIHFAAEKFGPVTVLETTPRMISGISGKTSPLNSGTDGWRPTCGTSFSRYRRWRR